MIIEVRFPFVLNEKPVTINISTITGNYTMAINEQVICALSAKKRVWHTNVDFVNAQIDAIRDEFYSISEKYKWKLTPAIKKFVGWARIDIVKGEVLLGVTRHADIDMIIGKLKAHFALHGIRPELPVKLNPGGTLDYYTLDL